MNNRRSFLKNMALSGVFFSLSSHANQKKDFEQSSTFKNLYGTSDTNGFFDLLKWKFSVNPQKQIKENENYHLKVIENENILNTKKDYICWCGHATFLIQIDGKKILTDPCLTAPPMFKRLTSLPFKIADIKPDYLIVSHGHFDHLDSDTLIHFKNTTALVPLNMTQTIKGMNSEIKTQEAQWFETYKLEENFEITFLPAHHWHRRSINDRDEILWGSFIIKNKNKTIYFAGDSGYSKHFEDIGNLFDSIDIAILPIGAYNPQWFMKSSHINPQEALQAFKDLKAKELIPMHFGTFDLTDEPLGEPEQILREIGKDENIRFLTIGEEYKIDS